MDTLHDSPGIVWKVTFLDGSSCHYGVKSTAQAAAGKCGTIEAIELKDKRFRLVKTVGSAEPKCETTQLEQWLDTDNHTLRRTMQKMMARLANLLDEDHFAEFECMASAAGVDPQSVKIMEPMDAWVDYAKRSNLLDENGVATDPHKTQTAWFAFTAAWNRCAAMSTQSTHQPDVSIKAGEIDLSDAEISELADKYWDVAYRNFDEVGFARALLAAKGGE